MSILHPLDNHRVAEFVPPHLPHSEAWVWKGVKAVEPCRFYRREVQNVLSIDPGYERRPKTVRPPKTIHPLLPPPRSLRPMHILRNRIILRDLLRPRPHDFTGETEGLSLISTPSGVFESEIATLDMGKTIKLRSLSFTHPESVGSSTSRTGLQGHFWAFFFTISQPSGTGSGQEDQRSTCPTTAMEMLSKATTNPTYRTLPEKGHTGCPFLGITVTSTPKASSEVMRGRVNMENPRKKLLPIRKSSDRQVHREDSFLPSLFDQAVRFDG